MSQNGASMIRRRRRTPTTNSAASNNTNNNSDHDDHYRDDSDDDNAVGVVELSNCHQKVEQSSQPVPPPPMILQAPKLATAQRRTEELIHIFSSTLTTLTQDAVALEQLTHLGLATGVLGESLKASNGNGDKMGQRYQQQQQQQQHTHPHHSRYHHDRNNNIHNNEWLDRLRQLDSVTSSLEQKVAILGDIVSEERRALKELITLKDEAELQGKLLAEMWKSSRDIALFTAEQETGRHGEKEQFDLQQQHEDPHSPTSCSNAETNSGPAMSNDTSLLASFASSNNQHLHAKSFTHSKPLNTFVDTNHNNHHLHEQQLPIQLQQHDQRRRNSTDPRNALHPAAALQPYCVGDDHQDIHHDNSNSATLHYLARVTTLELENVSRNIRGRIHLAVINEAIMDIEKVCYSKFYSLLVSKRNAAPLWNNNINNNKPDSNHNNELQSSLLSVSQRDSLEEQQQQYSGLPWVSEQELRQSCAFFRSGESTARSILLILKTLKRLKQVPARHSQVTYICMMTTTTNSNGNHPEYNCY